MVDNSIISALIAAAGAIIAAIITFRAALIRRPAAKTHDAGQLEDLDGHAAEPSVLSWLVPMILLVTIVISTGVVIWMQLRARDSGALPPPIHSKVVKDPSATSPLLKLKPL